MAAPTSTNEVTARKLSASISALWAKIKSTFQTLGNLVTTSTGWSGTPSDTKYPSEKLVKDSLDGKVSDVKIDGTSVVSSGTASIPMASSSVKGVVKVDTAMSSSSTNPVQNKVVNTAIESANTDSKLYANQKWGGAFRTSLSPNDTYFLQQRNCFFGAKPSAISVEYSTDGGTTWIDYGLTEAQKYGLFSQYAGTSVFCGKNTHILPTYTGSIQGTKDLSDDNVADQRLRITICCEAIANFGTAATTDKWLYATIRRIGIHMSTNSASRGPRHCVFTAMKKTDFRAGNDTWVNFGDYAISGDSGWNSIPCNNATSESGITFGDSYDNQYSMLRFEVWSEGVNTSPAPSQTGNMAVIKITAFSELCWSNASSNSNLANYGLPCMVDAQTGLSNFSKGIKFTARKLKTNLASTADSTFDGSADQTNIPVTGTLPVANGGTGKTSAKAAEYNLTTGKSEISDATSGDDRVVFELASPSESNGVTRGFRKLSTIWTWVKGLLSSESGVNISGSSASCTGNAATATELSAGADRTKLDGIEPNANNYTHPTSGANTSKGDTTAQTPSFGQTFKVLSATVDAMGHTTAIAEHTVKIPDSVAEGGPGGNSGLMSYQDKDRLDLMSDEANKVEASTNNGNIKIDGEETTVYAHPTSGANTSKGDTTAQTPGFGQTFKALSATVDSLGHTTSLAEHTVKIPNGLATGGPSGDRGLMSSADKDRLDLARVNVISTFFGTRSYTPVQYLANYVGDVGNWSNADNYDTSLLRVGDVVKFYVTVPLMANAHFIIDVKLDTVPGANAERVHGMTLAMYQADPHEPLDGTGSDADNFVIPGHYTIRNVTQITNKWPGSTAGDSDYTNLIVSRMVPNDVDIGSSSAYAINQLVLWRRRYLARDRYKSGNNWVWGAWQQFTYQDSNYAATGNVNRPVYVDENGMIKPCTYTWIVGSLGSASNTIYFT